MMTSIKQPLRPNEHISTQRAKDIFKVIRDTSEISKNDLWPNSDMTPSTLTRTLDELMTSEIIIESRLGLSTGGRRPILYQVNQHYGCAIGLDISPHISRLALVDLAGNIYASAQCLMTVEMCPDRLMDWVVDQAENWKQQYADRFIHWIGMGIGTFGILDRSAGVIRQLEWYRAPGWKDVEIVRILEERLGMPVTLDNGANSAITAAVWSLPTRQDHNWLYIHAATSIRSSMIYRGTLAHGINQFEGSLGQMIVQADGKSFWKHEGNKGCLDSYATVCAIQREANYRLFMGEDSLIMQQLDYEEQEVQIAHIIEAAKLGDSTAVDLLTNAATYLGIGLANLLNVLHPDKVILGGPLADIDLYFHTAIESALSRTYQQPHHQIDFVREAHGEQALVIGSALLILEQLA